MLFLEFEEKIITPSEVVLSVWRGVLKTFIFKQWGREQALHISSEVVGC